MSHHTQLPFSLLFVFDTGLCFPDWLVSKSWARGILQSAGNCHQEESLASVLGCSKDRVQWTDTDSSGMGLVRKTKPS